MALNLKDTLEILKRAGLDPNDRIKSTDTEQRLRDRLRRLEQDPWCEDDIRPPLRTYNPDPLDETQRRIDEHKNPASMPIGTLFDIDDL